jgi:hypothetical protein
MTRIIIASNSTIKYNQEVYFFNKINQMFKFIPYEK